MEIGDEIKFKSPTRWANRTVWRKINGFTPNGLPTVRYGGHAEFIVRLNEIKGSRKR